MAPAITVVARESEVLRGWKGKERFSSYGDWCENLEAGESVEDCIDKNTYSRSSALKDVLWGFNANNSILSDGLVGEDFTMMWQGKFFSFYAKKTMFSDQDNVHNSTRLSLVLGSGFTYQIFIHEPDFFEINYKPIFPAILKTVNPGGNNFNHFYNLVLTEVRENVVRFPDPLGTFMSD